MTTKQRNKVYLDFIKDNPQFIKNKVKSFAFKYNKLYQLDLLLDEAELIVLESITNYDSSKGNLKTWLGINIFNKLKKFIDYFNKNSDDDYDTLLINIKGDTEIDFDACLSFLLYFEKLHKLEQYIIISYYYDNLSIMNIANLLNMERRRVKNVLDTYTDFITKAYNDDLDESYEIFRDMELENE